MTGLRGRLKEFLKRGTFLARLARHRYHDDERNQYGYLEEMLQHMISLLSGQDRLNLLNSIRGRTSRLSDSVFYVAQQEDEDE
jgi:hypothetical protein